MSAVDFFDTNLLVYALDSDNPSKQKTAQALLQQARALGTGVVSFQTVQEALNVVQKKFKTRIEPADLDLVLDTVWLPLMQVLPSPELYRQTLRLQKRFAYSFYDSLVLACAQSAGAQRLLSEDFQHGQTIDGMVIHNPF